jgi:hypothetical protein
MAVAEVPFDLVGVKLAAPSAQQGTVAKADAIDRLCASTLPFATVVAPALPSNLIVIHRRAVRAMPRLRDWMNSNSWLVSIIVCVILIVLIL